MLNNFAVQVLDLPNWSFMQEPLYRWFLFLIALSAMTFAWNGVLSFI